MPSGRTVDATVAGAHAATRNVGGARIGSPRTPLLVTRHAEPDFAHLHQELKRNEVTLQLLWEEYAVAHPGAAYRYSQFCLLFKRFQGSLKRSMRQMHRAGEKISTPIGSDFRIFQ